MRTKWWKYLIMGVADVEANYTVVKAYQFTSLTSIQVLVVLMVADGVLRIRPSWLLSDSFSCLTAL